MPNTPEHYEQIDIDDYLSLKLIERTSYLCNIIGIEEPYLIGKIEKRNHSMPPKYFITDLINPKNGKPIGTLLKGAAATRTAFYGHELTNGLLDGGIVYFGFEGGGNDKGRISALGELLKVKQGNVKPFGVDFDADELNLSWNELTLPTLVELRSEQEKKLFFIEHPYRDLITGQIAHEMERLNERKKNSQEEENQLAMRLIALDEKAQKLDSLERRILEKENFLKRLNLGDTLVESKQAREEVLHSRLYAETPDRASARIRWIQQYIYTSHNLSYEESTLRKFYNALRTNQLLILEGPSGTGKTSLVSAFADSIGARHITIPVQSSWMDRQDLLGYYNPLSRMYVSTPLLDTLTEAVGAPDIPYIICLDEMNLAQVEYYLADILSLRELGRPIPLYSKQEYIQAQEELRWFLSEGYKNKDRKDWDDWVELELQVSNKDIFQYKQRYNNLQKFSHELTIPDNVRFVGTMNLDGTTRPLSPKVIDRSFIIRLAKQLVTLEKVEGILPLRLSITDFEPEAADVNHPVWRQLKTLEESLGKIQVTLNSRLDKQIAYYLSGGYRLDMTGTELLNDILLGKLLPKIHFLLNGQNNSHAGLIEQIKVLCTPDSLVYKEIESMQERAEQTRVFTYWG